ncbi:MAG TPA: hypothetical protein VGJ34_09300 [Gaiellaceae bacterium]|jgi:hypothetical protein
MSFDVLPRKADELLVVGSFQVMPARTFDRAHAYLPFLNAFTVLPRAPYFSAFRRVSSKAEFA